MGIRFHCPHCKRGLNIKQEMAGKKGACPSCNKVLLVPTESKKVESSSLVLGSSIEANDSSLSSGGKIQNAGKSITARKNDPLQKKSMTQPGPAQSEFDDPLLEDPDAVWFVRPPEGGQYGPAKAELLKQWIDEERVGIESFVWREGWADWLPANRVFKQLPDSPPPVPVASSDLAISRSSTKTVEYLQHKKRRMTMAIAFLMIGSLVVVGLVILLIMIVWK